MHADGVADLERTIGRLEATLEAIEKRQPLPEGVVFELTNVGGKGKQIGKDHVGRLAEKYGDNPAFLEHLLERTYVRDPQLAASKGRAKGGARGSDADPDIVPARDILTDDAKDELARVHSGKNPKEWEQQKQQERAAKQQADELAKQQAKAAREAQRKAEREARAAKKQAEKETRAAQRAALREERAKAKKQAAEERKAAGRGRKGTAAAQQVDEATRPSVSADTGAAKVDEEPGGKSPASKSRTKGSKKNAPAPGETPEVQRTRAKRATGFKPPESAAAPASAVAKKPAKRAAPSRSEAKEGAPKSPSATEHPGTAATPAAKAPTQDAPVTEGHRGAHQQPAPKAKEPGPAEQTTPTLKDEAAPRAGSEKAPQPPQHEENAPKAVKAKAKASVPENAQPIVRDPGGAPTKSNAPKPSRPVSSKGEAVTGALGKADAVLGAVRDFQQYQADGASTGEALTRAAGTLAANLKGGPAAAIVNSANAYDNARKSGQGKVEAMATAIGTGGGGIIASRVAPAGPVGTAVNLANTAAQALGAPQGVQDATTGAAALVPSNIVATTLTEGARSVANIGTALVTGDTKALDRQVQGYQAGTAGPWLQGYAQVTGMVADMAAGDDFDKALNKAAASGKGSWADRVGSKGGDALFELGQSKEAKSGKYGASVQGISMSLGIASDMIAGQSFEQALNKAAEAGKGSWTEKVGNALGDAAWDATEKVQQLSSDLPAAKQAIKDKWNKLWN